MAFGLQWHSFQSQTLERSLLEPIRLARLVSGARRVEERMFAALTGIGTRAMWWQKKSRSPLPDWVTRSTPSEMPLEVVKTMPAEPTVLNPNQSRLGPTVSLKGELAGKEDLVIEGQFEGTINLQDRSLTIGLQSQVKADIQANRVIIHGSVTGNISARERIEIRKTGRVLGDLVGPGIAIEEGAYFKGSIEILREEAQEGRPSSSLRAEGASA
jgi:cytoskeletal protein CcmA (bactofilin family)